MYQFRPVTDRVARLRKRYRDHKFTIDAERAMIVTNFIKENLYMPAPLKRANTLYQVCAKMTLRVEEDELIVGNLGKFYKGTALWPETAGIGWLYSELDDGSFYTRKQQEEPMILPDEEKEKLMTIRDFWADHTMWHGMGYSMPDTISTAVDSGVLTITGSTPNRVVATNHLIPNYKKVIDKGFGAVRAEAQTKLDAWNSGSSPVENGDQYFFYKSVVITCDAYITLAHRYAALCRETAQKTAAPGRRAELERMADSLDWIAEHPARTFAEAVQGTCLYQFFLYIDGDYQCPSFGRFDQYTYPYLKRDLEAGRLTLDQAQEIVDCFWIKCGFIYNARLRHTTRITGAYSSFQHMTIGGCDRTGRDATNPVTFMCLEAPARLLLHDPPLSLRVNWDAPDALMECAIESSKRAGGIPCFQNEKVILQSLIENKVYEPEDAMDFGIVGCQEIGASGNDYCASCSTNSCAYLNLGNIVNISLNNGINPRNDKLCAPQKGYLYEMESFEQVKQVVRDNLDLFMNWLCTVSSCTEFYHYREYPVPALSAMLDGCMESGVDCTQGGAKYNSYGTGLLGIATLIDSLIAVKYMIFDAKLCTARAFYDAWMANWEGHEDLRQQILAMPHHYGNNDPYADEVANWVMTQIADIVDSKKLRRGKFRVGTFTASAHVYFGTNTWATPNGRAAFESLSDAASPSQGADKNGPTAVLASACCFDHKRYTNGFALNMRLSPATLSREDSIDKLKHMIKTYFDMGGMEVQYNVVDSDTLRRAQANPEEYRDLIVRVAGFSAYFVELATQLQNDIIARTENCV